MQRSRTAAFAASFLLAAITSGSAAAADAPAAARPGLFARDNLVAWCIVPFDAKNRSPAERAAMVNKLGLSRVAYDWRENHVKEFENEILEYKKAGIDYFAFWGSHEAAFQLFEKHNLHPQIWQTAPSPAGATDAERAAIAAKEMLPLVERARKLGCQVGLYNHGGWGGEPANLVAVCRQLREAHQAENVGIVYNLHHGHGHTADFAAALASMKPYLLCLNLNGMTENGEARGQKILPLGAGELDLVLLKTIRDSGYAGRIGIIGHTQDDVEQRLADNLDGLDWLLPQLDGKAAGPKPKYRTWAVRAANPSPPAPPGERGAVLEGKPEFRRPPITVEARATLFSKQGFNILAASDTKQSGDHWEVFTMAGSGELTVYLPGRKPDHVRSQAMICDERPHHVAMVYEPARVRLLVDGKQVADQKIEETGKAAVPGGLAVGRLVEGGIGCVGEIDWVRISKGVREIPAEPAGEVKKDDQTLLLWRPAGYVPLSPLRGGAKRQTSDYSPAVVEKLAAAARTSGNAHRGAVLFASTKAACISCHKIGKHGGSVGPELTAIAKERKPEELVESILWPKRLVKPEFVARSVIGSDGRSHQGYVVRRDAKQLVLRDPTKGAAGEVTLAVADIEEEREIGTLMPDNLGAALSDDQLVDLVRFVASLGRGDGVPAAQLDVLLAHAQSHLHGAVKFEFDRKPLRTEDWPHWEHFVNRSRIYDFYTKQADFFRRQNPVPPLLAEFPGLDGAPGHWGNQDDQTWANERWNHTDLGSLQAGVFRGGEVTVPRGVCVRLGDQGELAACFNPDTLTYDAVWSGGFLKFSSVRYGFMHGVLMNGTLQPRPEGARPTEPFRYHGFYRHGRRVLFAYRIGERELLDAPWVENGKFTRVVAPRDEHPLRHLLKDAPPQWPQRIETPIELGKGSPYATDNIALPYENPWKAMIFCGGHAFLPDGSALVCTMEGDVWRVENIGYPSKTARWSRFAAGLHQALGMWIDKEGIFVLGRDQITRLVDANADGEADFYECFSNAHIISTGGHDFICGLERDAAGNFYTASGNQGLVRISPDGRRADVIATGFRNPDGIGIHPDGTLTVPCSEGNWTPATTICAVKPKSAFGSTDVLPHFGYPGPQNGRAPELPLVYLPRGLDNSAGGQVTVSGDRWGPLAGTMLHFSYGAGSHFLLLRDEVAGQMQGAVVPLAGEFRSGAHRGRFSPADGQLYVSGMQGWGSYTPQDGCFQRVRYTGDPVQLPTGFHVHENGIALTFSTPLDAKLAADAKNHFAQCWNYRYGPGYGSPEFSSRHPGMRGHDTLAIAGAHMLDNGKTLFLELPDLQPVSQLHLQLQSAAEKRHDIFLTVHRLDAPFTKLPNYQSARKEIQPHPLLADLAMITRSVPNPHRTKIEKARAITIETGENLSFKTRSFKVKAGEPIALTLSNPDVVPHNWALVKPGALDRVGEQMNLLIADPDAAYSHYIPKTGDVLAYTDIVLPLEKFTIYFRAPDQPGRYPYLCTFPGHWKVMNGEMIVEK